MRRASTVNTSVALRASHGTNNLRSKQKKRRNFDNDRGTAARQQHPSSMVINLEDSDQEDGKISSDSTSFKGRKRNKTRDNDSEIIDLCDDE